MNKRRLAQHANSLHGILLLDKQPGASSNFALQYVKRLLKAQKAGHTGSLDPLASGMLPLCFGEATKISGFLLDADKHYRVRCLLGVKTTTGDAEGEVVEQKPVPVFDRLHLQQVLARFTGRIEQIPPMYSAIKHQGQRLYALARQGITVERAARAVTIHELTLSDYTGDEFEIVVRCSKGTYVRTLAEDIGEVLGCGAHVTALRRLGVGLYKEEQMVTVEVLQQAAHDTDAIARLLLPIDSPLLHWPMVQLADNAAYFLHQGQAVLVAHAPTQGWVRLYSKDSRFLGVGEILDDGRVTPRRMLELNAKT